MLESSASELLSILPKRTQFRVIVEHVFGCSVILQYLNTVVFTRRNRKFLNRMATRSRTALGVAQPLLREAGDRADANYFERGLRENLM